MFFSKNTNPLFITHPLFFGAKEYVDKAENILEDDEVANKR